MARPDTVEDEARWNVASIHQVLPLRTGGQQCLCGTVLLTHRSVTEHIIDAYKDAMLAKVVKDG